METEHFKASELACKCCGEQQPSLALLVVLETLREHFGEPVIVTSGYRCTSHNTNVGGGKKSRHMKGIAADVSVRNVSPTKVADYLESLPYANLLGIGRYDTFTHIDVRGFEGRWEG